MTVHTSIIEDNLLYIGNKIKALGGDIEFELGNIVEKLDQSNSLLEKIATELLISNMPIGIRKEQREMTELAERHELLSSFIVKFTNHIKENPNDVSVDSMQTNINDLTKKCNELLVRINELESLGCVRVGMKVNTVR